MIRDLEQWLTHYESGHIDRRVFLQGLATLMTSARTAAAAPVRSTVSPSGLQHVEIKTTDLARSSAFYTRLLGAASETRQDRVIIPLGAGAARAYLSIGVGPIARVDHFAIKVPGMHPRDPKATLGKLTAAGYRARQADHSVYVMDPDRHEVELQAPTASV